MGTETVVSTARERELALGDRLLARIEAGPPPAQIAATTIDVSAYTDPLRHQGELALMMARPVPIVAASELGAGGFVTVDLLGRNVIVTRDADGTAHAMLNACAHRGATVESRPAGSARVLSCNFHGWSYDLDGGLRAVTDPALFSSTPCARGLQTLTCEERHGLIWVHPGPGRGGTVSDWLGPDVDRLFTDMGMAEMVEFATEDYDLACNWKMLTDGFLEIYHLKYLHRDSIAPYFPANTMFTERVGDHFVGWLPKNRLVRDLTALRRDEWQVLAGLTGAVILVPGTVVQWQAGHVELFSLRPDPTDPTRTTARLTMLVPTGRVDEAELWQRNWDRVRATIPGEDFAAAVDVQANINSGAVTELQIGANESRLIEHLDALIEPAVSATQT